MTNSSFSMARALVQVAELLGRDRDESQGEPQQHKSSSKAAQQQSRGLVSLHDGAGWEPAKRAFSPAKGGALTSRFFCMIAHDRDKKNQAAGNKCMGVEQTSVPADSALDKSCVLGRHSMGTLPISSN